MAVKKRTRNPYHNIHTSNLHCTEISPYLHCTDIWLAISSPDHLKLKPQVSFIFKTVFGITNKELYQQPRRTHVLKKRKCKNRCSDFNLIWAYTDGPICILAARSKYPADHKNDQKSQLWAFVFFFCLNLDLSTPKNCISSHQLLN